MPTSPAYPPDPARVPFGEPRTPPARASRVTRESIEAENAVARALARAGYEVLQVPEAEGAPDFLVSGRAWDCYAPIGANWKTYHTELRAKVGSGRPRVAMLLRPAAIGLDDLRSHLSSTAVAGLCELLAVVDGTVHRVL